MRKKASAHLAARGKRQGDRITGVLVARVIAFPAQRRHHHQTSFIKPFARRLQSISSRSCASALSLSLQLVFNCCFFLLRVVLLISFAVATTTAAHFQAKCIGRLMNVRGILFSLSFTTLFYHCFPNRIKLVFPNCLHANCLCLCRRFA